MRLRTIAWVPLVVLLVGGVASKTSAMPSTQLAASQNLAVANLAATRAEMQFGKNATSVSKTKYLINSVYNNGKRYIGTPYCRGGDGPRCFDCSGLTQQVYQDLGINIPRVAQDQYRESHRVSRSKARRGDLVFFMSGNYVYHVGIYAGKNLVLHSPKPGRKVKVERIWSKRVRFGRFYS